MSDYNSSLPVRTENDGDVVVKVGDRTIPSQQLLVNPDGSINVNTTDSGGSLTVDAIDLDIRDLVFATDKVDVSGSTVALDATTLAALETITANQGAPNTVANGWPVKITDGVDTVLVTAAGELGVLATAQPGVDIGDVTINNAAGAAAVNIQDGGNSITVDAINLDIRDLTHVTDSIRVGDGTDFISVNTDGSINVVIADGTPGTPINDYNTAVAVASAATSNHDYTVPGGETFYLNQIEASGTGKMKIEIQVNGTTRFVQFNSTANTSMSIHIENPIVATAGQIVRIVRTNRDNQAQDLYSTICGYLLP